MGWPARIVSHGTLGEFNVTFERDGQSSMESVEGSTVIRRTADTIETVLPSGISIVDQPSDDGRTVEIDGAPYVSLHSANDLSEIRHDGRALAAVTNGGPAARMSLVSEAELFVEQNGDGVFQMRGSDLLRSVQSAGGRVVAAESGDNTITYRWDGSELEGLATSGLVSGDISIVRSDSGVIESVTIEDSTFPLSITDGAITRLGPLEIQLDDDALRPRRITVGRIEEEWTYDDAGRLSERAVLVEGEVVFVHRVERDKAARVVRQRIDGPAPTDLRFEYEGGHLVEVSGDRLETFRYDERGRLTALNTTAVQVSSAGSPLTVDGHPVAMTDGGRISRMALSGGPVDIGYNSAGEVTTITTDAGTTTMTRDAFGRSIEIDDGTHVRRLLWDDAGPVALFDDAGSVIERYLRPPGSRVPEMVIRGDTVLRLVSDQIGSPQALIDTESGAVEQFLWSAYGELISGPEDFLFGFGGSVVLNARPLMVDLGVRTYIPAIGRWAQWDPLLHGGGGTDLYGYSANDPVNRYDPTGAEVKYCISERNLHGFLKTDKGEFGQDFGTGPPPWWPHRDMVKFFAGGSRWWRIFTRWGPQYKDDDPSQGPRSGEENTACFSLPPWLEVDEDCVNELTKPGTYAGTYLRPKVGYGVNVCHTLAIEVLNDCRIGDVQKVEQLAKDLLEYIEESKCCGAGATPQPQPDESLTGGAKGGKTGNPRQEPYDGIIWPPHG